MSRKRKKQGGLNPVRKITKTGSYTYYVTIPRDLISELGWRERQKVVVKRAGNKLVITDWGK